MAYWHLDGLEDADIVNLRSPLDADSRRVLFRASSAVLANSGHEPFGMVGLEAMAAGGVACTGCSGEDYAVSGHNALVLETADPYEFVHLFRFLRADPSHERALRQAGQVNSKALCRVTHCSPPPGATAGTQARPCTPSSTPLFLPRWYTN